MTHIAILGLGAMGSRMATNILKAGFPLTVWNRSPASALPLVEQGATLAPSPKAAAERTDIVLAMLTDDEASRAVWLDPDAGALLGLQDHAIAIESSTLTIEWTQTLARAVQSQGSRFLDAPVVGSRPQAEAAALIFLVGGKAETLTQVQHLLSCMSSAIHHVGEVGNGMAMKLAVNALFGIQVAALAEMLGILHQQGIPMSQAMECLGSLPVLSPAAKGAGILMRDHQHTPLFPIQLVEKDFRYALKTAHQLNALSPLSTATQNIYREALANGQGNENITSVVNLFS